MNFPIPPTFAEPIEQNQTTGRPTFSPIWLRWFLDVAQYFASIGLGGTGVSHNSLSGLQGGASSEYYHLTNADYSAFSGTRVTKGVETTDYVVIDSATSGLVLRDTQATPHYWNVQVNNVGVLITTDLGTSPP